MGKNSNAASVAPAPAPSSSDSSNGHKTHEGNGGDGGGGNGGGGGISGGGIGGGRKGSGSSSRARVLSDAEKGTLKQLAAMECQDKVESAGLPRSWSPFLSVDDAPDTYEWIKITLLSPLCIVRALSIIGHLMVLWVFAKLKLWGMADAAVRGAQPMPWWRNMLFEFVVKSILSSLLLCCGVFVQFRGLHNLREAKGKEVVGVFNHVSFLDAFVLTRLCTPTGVAKAGIDDFPFIGTVGRAMQVLFVARKGTTEGSSTSRQGGTIQLLKERMKQAAHFPIPLIAPEGVTTNGQSVVKFQTGAFALGVPVLPILLKYPYRHFNPGWTLADTGWLVIRMLCQVYTPVICTVLPLRYPSEAEVAEPAAYARAVQHEISAALGVPALDQDLYDCKAVMQAGFSVDRRGSVVRVGEQEQKRQAWI